MHVFAWWRLACPISLETVAYSSLPRLLGQGSTGLLAVYHKRAEAAGPCNELRPNLAT